MSGMRDALSGGVLIPTTLLAELKAARTAGLPLETGGFLIGRRRGAHLEVTQATYQGVNDVATRTSFDRADRAHTASAVSAWRADAGLSDVVGDWHSHPSGAGAPSDTDLRAWWTLAQAKRRPIVGLILGDETLSLHMANFRDRRIVRLASIEETATETVFASDAALVSGAWNTTKTLR